MLGIAYGREDAGAPRLAARLREIAGKPIVLFNRALPSSRERPICW